MVRALSRTADGGAMRVRVNGDEREVPDGLTVTGLVALLNVDAPRVAVERNRLVVKRADWPTTTLSDGDVLEVLTFVGGG